jgi:hypothetical protein
MEVPVWARLISSVEALGIEVSGLDALLSAKRSGGFARSTMERFFSAEVVNGLRVLLAQSSAACSILGDAIRRDWSQIQVPRRGLAI